MNREATARILRRIADVWPGTRVTNQAIDDWHSAVGHLEPDQADHALTTWLAESSNPPRPADLLATHRGKHPQPDKRRPDDVIGCHRCDHGWTDTTATVAWGTYPAVAPCPRCRPVTHERLLAGNYKPDWDR